MVGSVDVLVIGVGVGGLATATELLRRGVPGRRIAVVGGSLGGRLRTVATTAGDRLETGAGRCSRVLHPRLDRLMHRENLPVDPFAFAVSHCGTGTPGQVLGGLDLATLPAGGGFFDALVARVGPAAADAFVTATGYAALRDKDFPVAGGVEVARTHPECGSDAARHVWVRPRAGFGALVDRLVADLRRRDVAVRAGTTISTLRRAGDAVTVEMRSGAWRRPRQITARTVVLAMAPTEVDGLGLPADADLSWRPDARRIGLFKCFLTYDSAWWDTAGLRERCLITGNRLQKLYFDSSRRSIFFYCDGENSRYWSRMDAQSLSREVFRSIEEVAGRHVSTDLRRPTQVHSRYWPTGIAYLTQACRLPVTGVTALTDNILLASDSFTGNPGWIEGALEAAHAAGTLAARAVGRPVAAGTLAA